jgi:pimeloyl-ACP methyl ester carboxylesterase
MKSITNEGYLKRFNEVILENNITQPLILIGHSMGGSYARYISKHNPQVKFIITLDSSYYEEYVPYMLKVKPYKITYLPTSVIVDEKNVIDKLLSTTDLFIDHAEDRQCYLNSYEAGSQPENEYAFYFEANDHINDIQIREEEPRFYRIYTHSYCHSLHSNPEVADLILYITMP